MDIQPIGINRLFHKAATLSSSFEKRDELPAGYLASRFTDLKMHLRSSTKGFFGGSFIRDGYTVHMTIGLAKGQDNKGVMINNIIAYTYPTLLAGKFKPIGFVLQADPWVTDKTQRLNGNAYILDRLMRSYGAIEHKAMFAHMVSIAASIYNVLLIENLDGPGPHKPSAILGLFNNPNMKGLIRVAYYRTLLTASFIRSALTPNYDLGVIFKEEPPKPFLSFPNTKFGKMVETLCGQHLTMLERRFLTTASLKAKFAYNETKSLVDNYLNNNVSNREGSTVQFSGGTSSRIKYLDEMKYIIFAFQRFLERTPENIATLHTKELLENLAYETRFQFLDVDVHPSILSENLIRKTSFPDYFWEEFMLPKIIGCKPNNRVRKLLSIRMDTNHDRHNDLAIKLQNGFHFVLERDNPGLDYASYFPSHSKEAG